MTTIRITESQLNMLQINESNNQLNALINNEFTQALASLKLGDFIHLTFGKLNDEEEIEMDTVSIATLVVKDIEQDKIKTKFIGGKGQYLPFENNQIVNIFKNNSIDPVKGFIQVSVNEGDEEKKVNLPNFLGFTESDSLEGGQLGANDLEKIISSNAESLTANWDNFKGKAIGVKNWEPGFLGMDNIFFFPTGFLAADDILNKYGLSADSGMVKDFRRIRVKIIGQDMLVGEYGLKKGSEHVGKINLKNQILIRDNKLKYLLVIEDDVKVVRGGEYEVKSKFRVSSKVDGMASEKIINGKIKVLSLS